MLYLYLEMTTNINIGLFFFNLNSKNIYDLFISYLVDRILNLLSSDWCTSVAKRLKNNLLLASVGQ